MLSKFWAASSEPHVSVLDTWEIDSWGTDASKGNTSLCCEIVSDSPAGGQRILLLPVEWNDWWKFETLYAVRFVSESESFVDMGNVKIGSSEPLSDSSRPLPPEFESEEGLPSEYFSLGQDEVYYQQLRKLDPSNRTSFSESMRDMVSDPVIFEQNRREAVVRESLMRNVSESTMKGQFRRTLNGEPPLTRFDIGFNGPYFQAKFEVDPGSLPNSNVHAVIGRNGVGKSRLLQDLSHALMEERSYWDDPPSLTVTDEDGHDEGIFAGLIYVSFSAFDSFTPPSSWHSSELHFHHIGMQHHTVDNDSVLTANLTSSDLPKIFVDSVAALQ